MAPDLIDPGRTSRKAPVGKTVPATSPAPTTDATAPEAAPGEPVLRWSSSATTIPAVQRELTRLWASRDLYTEVDGVKQRHIAARTSVMNLVVIATSPEVAERAAATIAHLAGRHPSRTLIVDPRDPDGPVSLRAQIEAHCVLPRADAPETCAEMIHLQAGGAAGRHLDAVITPLLIHDLPVTIWWPGEPPFETEPAQTILAMADRLVVDGSGWSADGLARLRQMAVAQAENGLFVSDFALVRQARWREAIASVFDMPDLLPYLRYMRRIAVTYASHDLAAAPGMTNVVKPVYHVAWLASRLGMTVRQPLAPRPIRRTTVSAGSKGGAGWIHTALLQGPQADVRVSLGPAESPLPAGTTLQVELLAERRGSELRAAITGDATSVTVRAWLDGLRVVDRDFLAPRRTDVDLLEEAIELGVRDPIATATIRFAATLVSERLEPGTAAA
jgi:glucose-6-phosphate dehydrogenase assembly protein OpcA